jgi:trk system potassium uptake protein TrkH
MNITAFAAPILRIQSFILTIVTAQSLLVAVISVFESHAVTRAFLVGAGVAAATALPSYLLGKTVPFELGSRQIYVLTVVTWMVFALFGAIPLFLALPGLSFTDAIFESVSGLTTTGSTVLAGLDSMPHGILLWRGLLQWIGGIGILVMGIAILPYLRIGGMKLFRTESSDWSGKTFPRSHSMIQAISVAYITLTLCAVTAYWAAGMGLFDAVVHSMSTVSTGGYSNYDSSMGHFNDRPAVLWISSLFMLLSALPFTLYVQMFRGQHMAVFSDQQVRGFVGIVGLTTLVLSLAHTFIDEDPFFDSLTHSTFNIVSIITTTGYASEDYTAWSSFSTIMFFYLMFIGGCSGSTTGSIKIFRFQIGAMMLANQLRQMRHPKAILPTRYNRRPVTDDVIRSIIAFSFYFTLTIAILALCLSLLGLDFATALTGAATAVTNVGPGLGEVIGPAGNFAGLPDIAKWLLCGGMLLGRLEIMTVLILVTPMFWKT